jgi:propanol-preferring alcohol dehydrogenase
VAIAQGAEVHVLTRGREARELARRLGVASTGGPFDQADQALRDLAEGRVRGAAVLTVT